MHRLTNTRGDVAEILGGWLVINGAYPEVAVPATDLLSFDEDLLLVRQGALAFIWDLSARELHPTKAPSCRD